MPDTPRIPRGSKRLAICVLVLLAAAMTGWWLWDRSSAPRPNVIVFLLDTVRRDALGCYGHEGARTPRMDAVAADGVRFDQAVSTSGWTLPAIASLMTGTWPTIHGAMGRDVTLTTIRAEVPMATEVLKRAGFQTVGFANAAFVSPMVGVHRGFDLFDHRHSYNWDTRRADETIEAALAQLRRRRGSPGFYFIHLFDAHLDYDPPPAYAAKPIGGHVRLAPPITMEKVLELWPKDDAKGPPRKEEIEYIRSLYGGEVRFMDAQVGRFMDEMKSMGLYDDAIIVITSDHGEEFWEHGGFEHGHTLYDELVLVPLLIKFPRATKPKEPVVRSQVRLLDVMPTVFDVLGLQTPRSFVGESLMPLVRGEGKRDLPALSESTLYGEPQISLRGPRYKYVRPAADGEGAKGELYDWREDPRETKDLSVELPEVRERLRSQLGELHGANLAQAERMSKPSSVNMSPTLIEQLKSLGYIR